MIQASPQLHVVPSSGRQGITPGSATAQAGAGAREATAEPRISICIATYRRVDRLAALLADLARQQVAPWEVIVVDNDAEGSARSVVRARQQQGQPYPLRYAVQPEKNIAITRNLCVTLANGDWLAFIDDDERAPPQWLQVLLDTALRTDADGVLGPVVPVVPPNAPGWIRAGHFYDWSHQRTGTEVAPRALRFGNLMLRQHLLHTVSMPFDPAYGQTGGEDGDLLLRLQQAGARMVWCEEALVTEPIEAARLKLRWLALRALRGGQDFARHRRAGRLGPYGALSTLMLVLDATLKGTAALGLAVVNLPFGRHRSAYWLLKGCANAGKISLCLGLHYREYGPGK